MVLQSSELKFRYPQQNQIEFPDISLKQGEAALLLGPSGSGKSTLLNLLAGLQDIQNGSIHVLKQDLDQLKDREMEKFRAKNYGLVFQKSFFLPYLSLEENLRLAANYQGLKVKMDRIHNLFNDLNIYDLRQKKPAECSIGEQQRASIARALMHEPPLLLADEPSSALDDKNADMVASLLMELCQKHSSTLLVVTHDARLKSLISKSYQL